MRELRFERSDGICRIAFVFEPRTRSILLLLSTLRGYVSAMGGTLELVARFPDRPSVVLSGLAGLDDKPAKA